MKKLWLTKRSVRIGILLVIGFMIGAVTSYMTALQKAKYMGELQQQELKTGNKVVRNPDGTFKVVPLDKPRPGTEIPTPLQDEPLEKPPEKTADDKPEESVLAPTPDITDELLEKQANVRAHTQPPMGMYVPGHFTLKDHNGREVTEKSWPGKYLLVYFGYAHCPDICPVTLAKMTKAIENLGPLARGVQPLRRDDLCGRVLNLLQTGRVLAFGALNQHHLAGNRRGLRGDVAVVQLGGHRSQRLIPRRCLLIQAGLKQRG